VIIRRHQTRGRPLDEKGKDIKQHKDHCQLSCTNAENFLLWDEEVNHASGDHVDESVGPDWRQDDQQLLRDEMPQPTELSRGVGPERKARGLPQPGHDDDPAKLLQRKPNVSRIEKLWVRYIMDICSPCGI
jgi:hypothetical protein